jgi:DNA-binding NtrC family response regulator
MAPVEAEVAAEGEVVYRPGMTMADVERAAILAALRETKGNRRKAAEILGIGERTLYRKLKEYAIV